MTVRVHTGEHDQLQSTHDVDRERSAGNRHAGASACGGRFESPAPEPRRVTSGTLDQIGHQTYQLPGAPKDAPALLRALVLDIGGDVWLSGTTAAALHGFDGHWLRPPFDITVARGRNIARVGHRIHTTTRIELIDRRQVERNAPPPTNRFIGLERPPRHTETA